MRWYKATLYRPMITGKDRLGHEIVSDDVKVDYCIVRKAPVKAEQGDIEGNRYKTITRAFLTPQMADTFKGITSVGVLGRKFRLENVTSLENGHTMLTCVYCKPEVDDED